MRMGTVCNMDGGNEEAGEKYKAAKLQGCSRPYRAYPDAISVHDSPAR